MVDISKPELDRMKTLHALDVLSRELQSDVLSDGRIPGAFGIKTHRPVAIGDKTIPQDVLFAAFRVALESGKSTTLEHGGSIVSSSVHISEDGAGIVEVSKQRLRFDFVGLLHSNPKQREVWLEKYLARTSLTAERVQRLRSRVVSSPYLNYDFLGAMMLLQDAPQSFVTHVSDSLQNSRLKAGELLPPKGEYWENLTAAVSSSKNLKDFVAAELNAEFRARASISPEHAIWSASLTFCAQNLVPLDTLSEFDNDVVLRMVKHLATLDDHFSLIGGFEIAARWFLKDNRFVDVGTQILTKLKDESFFEKATLLYEAAFVVGAACMPLHRTWRKQPAYWRRLSLAAHASLFARAAAPFGNEAKSLSKWAFGECAHGYVVAVSLEFFDEPRWRPEWIRLNYLRADFLGRMRHAIASIDKASVPQRWQEYLAKVHNEVHTKHWFFLSMLPAVGESTHVPPQSVENFPEAKAVYAAFENAPTLDNLVQLASLIFTYGCPQETLDAIHVFLSDNRDTPPDAAHEDFRLLTTVISHAAVQHRDANLADKLGDFCLRAVRNCNDPDEIREVVFRIIEGSAADTDRDRARETTSKRLEALAFSIPAQMLGELLSVLRHLQSFDESLMPKLGRAVAAARLGMRKTA